MRKSGVCLGLCLIDFGDNGCFHTLAALANFSFRAPGFNDLKVMFWVNAFYLFRVVYSVKSRKGLSIIYGTHLLQQCLSEYFPLTWLGLNKVE